MKAKSLFLSFCLFLLIFVVSCSLDSNTNNDTCSISIDMPNSVFTDFSRNSNDVSESLIYVTASFKDLYKDSRFSKNIIIPFNNEDFSQNPPINIGNIKSGIYKLQLHLFTSEEDQLNNTNFLFSSSEVYVKVAAFKTTNTKIAFNYNEEYIQTNTYLLQVIDPELNVIASFNGDLSEISDYTWPKEMTLPSNIYLINNIKYNIVLTVEYANGTKIKDSKILYNGDTDTMQQVIFYNFAGTSNNYYTALYYHTVPVKEEVTLDTDYYIVLTEGNSTTILEGNILENEIERIHIDCDWANVTEAQEINLTITTPLDSTKSYYIRRYNKATFKFGGAASLTEGTEYEFEHNKLKHKLSFSFEQK